MLRKLKCSLNIFLNWFKFSESKSKEIPVNDIWKWIKIKCSFKSNLFDYQGLKTDNHFTFEEHTNYLCQTANYKLHALRRIGKCLPLDALCFAFINSPFNFTTIYAKMENIHHKVFKIGFNHDASHDSP